MCLILDLISQKYILKSSLKFKKTIKSQCESVETLSPLKNLIV